MFRRIAYGGDPLDGIVQHIKNQTNENDIIQNNFAKILVPSYRTTGDFPSGSEKIVFGIYNDSHIFWSSINEEPNKFISIFLKYSIILEGIGIRNYSEDWYKKYLINCSNDLITWDYQVNFSTESIRNLDGEKQLEDFYFPLPKSKPCKFINITPYSSYPQQLSNYAFYRIELFGRILDPYSPNFTQMTSKFSYCFIFVNTFILLN